MKNLDDFLRARNEQKQAEESEKIALEELEVNKNEQTELANTKQQLELLKESLSAEKTGRDYYEKIKRNAEMQIAPIEKTLEANGLSKEELLNNPEYQDLEETNALSVATANLAAAAPELEMYSSPSVDDDNTALRAKLESLGITIPAGEMTEDSVQEALENRLIEVRLEIPEERESVIRDIIATYKIKSDRIDLRQGVSPYETNGSFKDVTEGLENQIRYIPIVANNPELKKAIVEAVVTENILSQSKVYQEQQAKRAEHEKKVATYAEVEAKLPKYIEALNTNFLTPLQERLSKLNSGIANQVLSNPEFKAILDLYTFEGQWGSGQYPRKITGLNLNDAVPSVAQIDKHLSSNPWDSYKFKAVLETLDGLDGTSYEDFNQRNQDNIFLGKLKELTRELIPSETVPRAERFSEDMYQEWDRGFAEMENRARDQAKVLSKYEDVKRAFTGNDISEVETAHKKINVEQAPLKKALEELRELGTGAQVRFEAGNIIVSIWGEAATKRYQEQLIGYNAEILQIDESLKSLGQRPTSIFSKKGVKSGILKKQNLIMKVEEQLKVRLQLKEASRQTTKTGRVNFLFLNILLKVLKVAQLQFQKCSLSSIKK